MRIDSYGFYKYITRSILLKKTVYPKNSYMIPTIYKVVYSFRLFKIEDLDDVQIYNYLYFFKFFLGTRGFLTRLKSFSNLGVWTYSLKVCVISSKPRNLYNNLYKFVNEYIYFIDKNYLIYQYMTKNCSIYKIIVKDLNFFSDRKTNIGLFNLHENLIIDIYIDNNYILMNKLCMQNTKILSTE